MFARFLFISAAIAVSVLSETVSAETIQGQVVGVSDGDTITVLSASHEQFKIRLAGIDAPEKSQPYGQRAKEAMSDLAFGKQVSIDWAKRDRYQRIIGKVWINGHDAGLSLISTGLAWHYKKYESEQEPSDRILYAQAEERAKAHQLGLWIDPNPLPPWEFRAERRGR